MARRISDRFKHYREVAKLRDILILAIMLLPLPFCFRQPYYGVLMWAFISYMNPHRYAWSNTVYNFPVEKLVAVVTFLGLLHTRRFNKSLLTRESILVLLLWAWMGVTLICATQVSLFAGHIQDGTEQLIQISKILLMTFVTVLLVDSPGRLRQLVLVIALSIGLRALWVSIFGVETLGEYRVYGPHDSFLADNNDFGLALNMILPLLYFSIPSEPRRWLRICLWMCFLAGIFAVILTYSRGSLLGLIVVLTMIAAMSRYRIISTAFVAVTALLVLSFAPPAWMDRMTGLAHGEIDSSAKQRLIGWRTGWNLAMDYPITGGGLAAYPDVVVFRHYQPEPMPGGRESEGPHSIYFQVLGENGFVGLALFFMLLGSCLVSVHVLRRSAKKQSSRHWAIPYTRMFEVSLAAFMVNGAFLGRAYFDLWYEIVAGIVLVKLLYRRELANSRDRSTLVDNGGELQRNCTPVNAA